MDLSLAKNCEEKTGKQTAEAENDVPETKATCSCLPGVSKNNKTKKTKREMKHKKGRGEEREFSAAHQARKQLMPVRLSVCLSVRPPKMKKQK